MRYVDEDFNKEMAALLSGKSTDGLVLDANFWKSLRSDCYFQGGMSERKLFSAILTINKSIVSASVVERRSKLSQLFLPVSADKPSLCWFGILLALNAKYSKISNEREVHLGAADKESMLVIKKATNAAIANITVKIVKELNERLESFVPDRRLDVVEFIEHSGAHLLPGLINEVHVNEVLALLPADKVQEKMEMQREFSKLTQKILVPHKNFMAKKEANDIIKLRAKTERSAADNRKLQELESRVANNPIWAEALANVERENRDRADAAARREDVHRRMQEEARKTALAGTIFALPALADDLLRSTHTTPGTSLEVRAAPQPTPQDLVRRLVSHQIGAQTQAADGGAHQQAMRVAPPARVVITEADIAQSNAERAAKADADRPIRSQIDAANAIRQRLIDGQMAFQAAEQARPIALANPAEPQEEKGPDSDPTRAPLDMLLTRGEELEATNPALANALSTVDQGLTLVSSLETAAALAELDERASASAFAPRSEPSSPSSSEASTAQPSPRASPKPLRVTTPVHVDVSPVQPAPQPIPTAQPYHDALKNYLNLDNKHAASPLAAGLVSAELKLSAGDKIGLFLLKWLSKLPGFLGGHYFKKWLDAKIDSVAARHAQAEVAPVPVAAGAAVVADTKNSALAAMQLSQASNQPSTAPVVQNGNDNNGKGSTPRHQ